MDEKQTDKEAKEITALKVDSNINEAGLSDNEFYDAEEFDNKHINSNSKQEQEIRDDKKLNNEEGEEVEVNDEDEEEYVEDDKSVGSDLADFDSISTADQIKEINSKFNNMKVNRDKTKAETEQIDNQEDEEEKFVPLHERLNKEKSNNQKSTPLTPEEIDPYYINESLLETEQANLTEADKEEKLKEAQSHKQQGNELFKEEKYLEALEFYTKSLRICPLVYTKERSIFYSNRSACFFKMNQYDKCIKECTSSIDLDDTFIKPILRRIECNQFNDKLDDVLTDYKRLCELEPRNVSHKQKCFELEEKIKERNEKLKEEMMGKLKELGNLVLKPFGLSTNNFQFVQDPATGSYSVNFNK